MHCVGSSSQLGATTYTADYQNSMPEAGPDIMGQPTAALSLDFAEESVSDWNWPPASYELSSVPMRNRIGESGQPVPAPLSNSMADSSQAVPDYQGSSAAAASHSNDSSPNRGTLRLPKVSPSSISRRSSAAECDINSAASSPMSLQLSQLLGPGALSALQLIAFSIHKVDFDMSGTIFCSSRISKLLQQHMFSFGGKPLANTRSVL